MATAPPPQSTEPEPVPEEEARLVPRTAPPPPLLTEVQLRALYERVVRRPPAYFARWERLPPCPVAAWGHAWAHHDFPRAWCVLDFRAWAAERGLSAVEDGVLGYTCASDPELAFLRYRTRRELAYPPHDLHALPATLRGRYDFFMFNQTLEHLYNPLLGLQNVWAALKPGGHAFTSVPTLNIPHLTPIHFGGLTPMGLATLLTLAGFEILEMGQWGCERYLRAMFARHAWPGYDQLQVDGRVENEERNVVQCWALVRKPLAAA
jgi:SAM-dependent methyltransferase